MAFSDDTTMTIPSLTYVGETRNLIELIVFSFVIYEDVGNKLITLKIVCTLIIKNIHCDKLSSLRMQLYKQFALTHTRISAYDLCMYV